MYGLAQALCGGRKVTPATCPQLFGMYQYMAKNWNNQAAAGAEQNQWPVDGSTMKNRFALCVGK